MLIAVAPTWGTIEPNEQKATIERLISDVTTPTINTNPNQPPDRPQKKRQLIEQFFTLFKPWADTVTS